MSATLYRVQTRTDAIEGYDDVLITWAAEGRMSPVAPYADVIEGLGSGDEADLVHRGQPWRYATPCHQLCDIVTSAGRLDTGAAGLPTLPPRCSRSGYSTWKRRRRVT
jgi:hypothetical protein